MPFKIIKKRDYYFVVDPNGRVYGKHTTKIGALRQQRAIYANYKPKHKPKTKRRK